MSSGPGQGLFYACPEPSHVLQFELAAGRAATMTEDSWVRPITEYYIAPPTSPTVREYKDREVLRRRMRGYMRVWRARQPWPVDTREYKCSDEKRAYARDYWHKFGKIGEKVSKTRAPIRFKCPECGDQFVRHFVRTRRKWCSEVCKVRAWRRRRAAKTESGAIKCTQQL